MLVTPWLLLAALAVGAVACVALGVYLVTEGWRADEEARPRE